MPFSGMTPRGGSNASIPGKLSTQSHRATEIFGSSTQRRRDAEHAQIFFDRSLREPLRKKKIKNQRQTTFWRNRRNSAYLYFLFFSFSKVAALYAATIKNPASPRPCVEELRAISVALC